MGRCRADWLPRNVDPEMWYGEYRALIDQHDRQCQKRGLSVPIQLPLPEDWVRYPTADMANPCPTVWDT